MKRALALVLALMLVLPGCAIKDPYEASSGSSVTVETLPEGGEIVTYNGAAYTSQAMAQAQQNCYLYHKDLEMQKWAAVGTMENEIYKTFVVMHSDSMEMVRNTFGKDLCAPGTNEFDAYIAYAEQAGATNRAWINFGQDLAKTAIVWGFGSYAVGKAFDAAGDSISIAGDGSSVEQTSVRQTQVAGRDTGDNFNEPNNSSTTGLEEEPITGPITEEFCLSQGLTLRESTGECITWEQKSLIESAAMEEDFPVESENPFGEIEVNELEVIE